MEETSEMAEVKKTICAPASKNNAEKAALFSATAELKKVLKEAIALLS